MQTKSCEKRECRHVVVFDFLQVSDLAIMRKLLIFDLYSITNFVCIFNLNSSDVAISKFHWSWKIINNICQIFLNFILLLL